MAKKEVVEEEIVDEEPAAPRIGTNFMREDLNELRDVVNQLWAERG